MSAVSISLVALLFPIACHHFNADEKLREVNPGILAEVKLNEATYETGIYANSLGRTTFTVQRRFSGWQSGPVDIGARVGLCTGYSRTGVLPCGGASIRFGDFVDVMIVPPVRNLTPAVAALTIRVPL